MTSMMRILEDLSPLNRVPCSSDYDQAVRYLSEILPFEVIQVPDVEDHNGWVIPPKWDVVEAMISRDRRVVFDGKKHALGVIALSAPFRGTVALDELKRHLHYDHRFDDALTFHFRQQFRSWDRDWGFSVPKRLYDALEPGEYNVVIETRESAGVLKLMEYTHRGELEQTVVFCANLDHPGVANDGIAGVAAGMEVFQRLRHRPTKLSYRLVLIPGIIGSEYYLWKAGPEGRRNILEGLCLWMLGSKTPLALQESRGARSNIEHCLARALGDMQVGYRRAPFEQIIINDEYIWEAYGIAMPSLSRFPYPEYHSSRDDVSAVSGDSLEEAVRALILAIEHLESSPLVFREFEGTVCLSNPRYDLYIDPGQIAFGQVADGQTKKFRMLMDYVPTLRNPTSVRSIAEHVALPESVVLDYLRQWEKKGLLTLR